MCVQELLAAVMSTFEDLYKTMESSRSFAPLLPLYYRYWLHGCAFAAVVADGRGALRDLTTSVCPPRD